MIFTYVLVTKRMTFFTLVQFCGQKWIVCQLESKEYTMYRNRLKQTK